MALATPLRVSAKPASGLSPSRHRARTARPLRVGPAKQFLDRRPAVGVPVAADRLPHRLEQPDHPLQGQGEAPLQSLHIQEGLPALRRDGGGGLARNSHLGLPWLEGLGPGERFGVNHLQRFGQIAGEVGRRGVGACGIEAPAGPLPTSAPAALQQPVHLPPLGINVLLHRHQPHEGVHFVLDVASPGPQLTGRGAEELFEVLAHRLHLTVEVEIVNAVHLTQLIRLPVQPPRAGAQHADTEILGEFPRILGILQPQPVVDGCPFLIRSPVRALAHQTHHPLKLPRLQLRMLLLAVDRERLQ